MWSSIAICLSLCGDAFCAGEMRRQELSGSVQRRGRFVKDRVIGLEDVGHPRGLRDPGSRPIRGLAMASTLVKDKGGPSM